MDFFEDQLVAKKYDWRTLLKEFMFEGKTPLVNGLISGREYSASSANDELIRIQSRTRSSILDTHTSSIHGRSRSKRWL